MPEPALRGLKKVLFSTPLPDQMPLVGIPLSVTLLANKHKGLTGSIKTCTVS